MGLIDDVSMNVEKVTHETIEEVGQLPDKIGSCVEDVCNWFVNLW